MEAAPLWIGIDVAKDQLDIALGSTGESWSVTPCGHLGARAAGVSGATARYRAP
jgi:hypothetical protein